MTDSSSPTSGFRFPAEWEPQSAILLAWALLGRGAAADNLVRCYEALSEAGFFPPDELPLVRGWADDVQAASATPATRAA